MADECGSRDTLKHHNSYPASTDIQILDLQPKPWPNSSVSGRSKDSEADYLLNAFSPIAALSCSMSSTYTGLNTCEVTNLGFSSTSQYLMPTQEYLWRHQYLPLILLVLEENIVGNNSGGINSESCCCLFFKLLLIVGIPVNEEVICSHLTYFYWWFKQPSKMNVLHHLINSGSASRRSY